MAGQGFLNRECPGCSGHFFDPFKFRLSREMLAGSASLYVLPALVICLVANINAHDGEISLVSWASRAHIGHRMRLL
jgi:hypothetical protein